MTDIGNRASRRRAGYAWLAAGPVAAAGALAMFMAIQPAVAATAPVGLGTAGSFAVLGGTTVTNTGPSLIRGNLGVSPGTAVTGFPPGIVTGGTIHRADGVAGNAQSDLTTAYNDAAGRSPTANVPSFIGAGQTLAPGVYQASSSLEVGGSLTLDAQGDPNAVWIFQAPSSTLTTDSASSVNLTNGAQACNVFWQVGSSATLGTNSTFVGSILALTSITVQTGDTVHGRALARNGAVTLDDDTITASHCATTPTPTPTATTPTPTPTRTRPVPTPTATSPTPTPTRTRPVPTPTATSPTPTPTRTRPVPTPTRTGPVPTPTRTGPKPKPTSTGTKPAPAPTSTGPGPRPPAPAPAPAPAPVGATFPVTG
jgi:Ice-binding-like